MNLRFINTKVHGVLDYTSAVLFPLIPRLFGWSNRVAHLHDTLAIGTVASSVMTNYELGVVRKLPMEAHLAIDALEGVVLLSAAALMDDEDDQARIGMAGLGLFCLAAAFFTDPNANRRRHRTARRAQPVGTEQTNRMTELTGL
jgi:hypothetical protein